MEKEYKNPESVKACRVSDRNVQPRGQDFSNYNKSARISMEIKIKNPEWVKLVKSLTEMFQHLGQDFPDYDKSARICMKIEKYFLKQDADDNHLDFSNTLGMNEI